MKSTQKSNIKIWGGTLIAFVAVLMISPETVFQAIKIFSENSLSNNIVQLIKIPLGCFISSAVINAIFNTIFNK